MDEPPRPPLKRFCTFQRAPTKWWELPLALFQPSPIHHLIHLERMEQLRIETFRYIWAIDDFDATIRYGTHELKLWMGWEGDLVLMSTEEVPAEIFERVCSHLHRYKWVPPSRVNEWKRLYKRTAKATWYEK
jgi:hypothetical protein